MLGIDCGGGQGGGSPGEQGAGGVRETGEERAGSGISMMAGSGREIPKGKLPLIVTAHHPVKETNPTKFLDFHLTFSKALSPPQRLPLGIPIKISIIEKNRKRAGDDGKRETAGASAI